MKLWGLGIAGFLQGKSALSMEKGCKIAGKPHDNYRTYDYHEVSPQFLQPFSIDSADFPAGTLQFPAPVVFLEQKFAV